MSIETEFRNLFSETVTIYKEASMDAYGRHTFSGSGSVIPAHLVSETRLTRDVEGQEVVERGKVYLYGVHDITTDDKITLADGASPIIIAVDTPHDQNGAHHTVVTIGRDSRG